MRNGEVKTYRRKNITKVNGKCFRVGGFLVEFDTERAAKDAIDAMWAEDEALENIDRYVRTELGGWM